MAGDDVGERGLRAAIGHMHHFDAGLRFELRRRQMRGGADALRGVGQFAGIGLAVVDELFQRRCRKVFADDQNVGDFRQHGDGNELGRLVAELAKQQMIERKRGGRCDQQGVAIRRCARDVAGADIHRSAGDVLDDRRLAPLLAELVCHDARERVGGRTGRGRNHDLDRSRGERFLRGAWPRPKRRAHGGHERDRSTKAGHSFLHIIRGSFDPS